MVQVDISQLSGECNVWREKLRHYREELNNDEAKLREVAGKTALQRTTQRRRTSPQSISHSAYQHPRSQTSN